MYIPHFSRQFVIDDIDADIVYVFGDNVKRRGRGGQAKACRGLPNTIGIRTKYAPGRRKKDYFGQDELTEKLYICEDILVLERVIAEGKFVVFPDDGIGTGMAELPTRAPAVAKYLERKLEELGIYSKEKEKENKI